ncbi:MAG TPA: alanine--tRNA ligase-related protein, partial [Chthoniobacterales bacterium]
EEYPWVWTQEDRSGGTPEPAGGTPTLPETEDGERRVISGEFAFRLYDEQGFPLDLTELMARERGLTVDVAGFDALMEQQRARARAAQKKETITLSAGEISGGTTFVGYEQPETTAHVLEAVALKDRKGVVLDATACYAEMGGQVGDTGELKLNGSTWRIANTQKAGNAIVHVLADGEPPQAGAEVQVRIDVPRRRAIERHHTVTHLLHWALHEVVSRDAVQKGSYVGPEKLTFDFSSAALTPEQVRDVEKLVNERIVENAHVSWMEMPYAEVKPRPDIMQFFGDKYGDTVRLVQIGGEPRALDGYSMELCGGTHVRGTGEIGLFRIVGEAAIAAGVRRVEAVAGLNAYEQAKRDQEFIRSIAGKLNSPIADLEKRIESMLAQQKALEKTMKALEQKQAVESARQLLAKAQQIGATSAVIENLGSATGDQLQAIADGLKQQQFKGVIVLAGAAEGNVALVASVSPELTANVQAGKIIQAIAPIVGGKGGGRPDNARGAGKDTAKIDDALAHARTLLGS